MSAVGEVPFVRQVVLDCAHPRALAEFYRELLGYEYRTGDAPPAPGEPDPVGDDYLVIRPQGDDPSSGRGLGFAAVRGYEPPVYGGPAGEAPGAVRQMLYLCMTVPDRDALARQRDRALSLGARLLEDRFDDPDEALLVLADVAGHPFCLYVP